MRSTGWCLLLAWALLTPVLAEDEAHPVDGEIEFAFRSADINGSEDKYREDVNLDDGAFYLSSVRLDYRPSEAGLFDRMRLDARNLGGEPHSDGHFSIGKANRFDLDVRYRRSDYFYRDAGYLFRDGGDLHTWDAQRQFFDLDLDIRVNDRLTLQFGADHQERDGGSTTSRTLQEDEFVLDRPVDQTVWTYRAGASLRIGWADVTVEQRLSTWENRWEQTTGPTDGLAPGMAALDSYRQLGTEEADAPMSRISVAGHPHDRFRFAVGYARIDAEVDFDTDGAWSGVDASSAAFSTTLTNTGRTSRDSTLWDADVSVGIHDRLEVTLDYSRREYDENGTIDYVEEQMGGSGAGLYVDRGDVENALEMDTYGVTLNWQATPQFGAAIGAGRQKRTKAFQLSGPEVETERTIYRARLRWRPNAIWNLRADYEQGDDEEPLTPVSVTSTDRIVLRADVRPVQHLVLSFQFRDESKENEDSTPFGVPTDDTPPADEITLARFDVTTWGVVVTWRKGKLMMSGGYTRTEIDSDADIVFVTGSTFSPAFDIFTTLSHTGYTADQNVFHGNLDWSFGRGWTAGARASLYQSEGTFPLDSTRYGADVRYRFPWGMSVRAQYARYEYDEDNPFAGDPSSPTPHVNAYDADLWTLGLGYRF